MSGDAGMRICQRMRRAAPAEATEEVVVTDEEQAATEQAAAWQAAV